MSKLKTNFSIEHRSNTFYTSGKIGVTNVSDYLLCCCQSEVNLFDVTKGQVEKSFADDDGANITCFALSPDNEILVSANQNFLLRQWQFKTKSITRTWKSQHTAPIACMDFDFTSRLLCIGGADGCVSVWDLTTKCCMNMIKNHSGVVNLVKFHPHDNTQLFTSCNSYQIKLWNIKQNKLVMVLEGHYSVVTSLQFSSDSNLLYSSGRDKVVLIWDLNKQSKRILAVFESVESMVLLPGSSDIIQKFSCLPSHEDDHIVVAGSKGRVSVWNAKTCHCVAKSENFCNEEEARKDADEILDNINGFVQGCLVDSFFVTVTADQTIIFFDVTDLSVKKQFVGNNGSILDLKFVGDDYLAVVTNSNQLKLYDTRTWSCSLYNGHTDIIVSLDSLKVDNKSYVVTGSKDNTIQIWVLDEETFSLRRIAVGEAHTHTVNTVCFFRHPPKKEQKDILLVSGSSDRTLKLWKYKVDADKLSVKLTVEGHVQDINSIAISPDLKFIATGSKDKTAKLWSADLSLVGTLKGHKRGVWFVHFSNVDRVLATASADTTIKLWNISSLQCIKTFEGHESAVLKLSFVTRGMQILSCGSDGLMKLWTVKTNECSKTIDAHDDKVWAMAVNASEDRVATGAGDGSIIYWKDVTEEEHLESITKNQEFKLKEQELMNLLHMKQYGKALILSISLDQPNRALFILKEMMKLKSKKTPELSHLQINQIEHLLEYSICWNQNAKNCLVAQFVLNFVLTKFPQQTILKFTNIERIIQGMLPYTDRHYTRIKQHLCKATFADYLLQSNVCSTNSKISVVKKSKNMATIGSKEWDVEMETD